MKYWTVRIGSDSYAKKLIKITKEKTRVMALFPESGIDTELPSIRMSAMGHFRIFYKITPSELIIVAFWDNRQDPRKLLEAIGN